MYFRKNELWTEDDDQCSTCSNLTRCPLADALQQGVVLMAQESLGVKNCGLYDERPPSTLKLVHTR